MGIQYGNFSLESDSPCMGMSTLYYNGWEKILEINDNDIPDLIKVLTDAWMP